MTSQGAESLTSKSWSTEAVIDSTTSDSETAAVVVVAPEQSTAWWTPEKFLVENSAYIWSPYKQ